ncbi:MAG: AAA family ATPase [Planctomycetota bacterium]
MRIEAVFTRGLPPFRDQTIRFPVSQNDEAADVQLLTGNNGTGKTRLLCLLAAAFGNPTNLKQRCATNETNSSVLLRMPDDSYGVWIGSDERIHHFHSDLDSDALVEQLEQRPSNSMVPSGVNVFARQKGIEKIVRPDLPGAAFAFRGTSRVTDAPVEPLKTLVFGMPEDYLDFDREPDSALLCQSMVNLKMTAAMESLRTTKSGSKRATQIISRLEKTISDISGRDFYFEVVPHPTIRIRPFWGIEMAFDQLPDGLRSVIGWLVACVANLDAKYPDHASPLDIPVVLLVDEPESHLHVAWQRLLLPAAQQLFPNAQVIAATHSPFAIASVNSGWLHTFKFGSEDHSVEARGRTAPRGDSYIDAVEDTLGVDEWFDPETEDLLSQFRERSKAVKNNGDLSKLQELGNQIASRGSALQDIMARELRQAERLLTAAAAKP